MEDTFRPSRYYKSLSLKEKASLYAGLVREPGWQLLRQTFVPEVQTRIVDHDSREAFLYEAIRAQVIQEVFNLPWQVIQQVDRDYAGRHTRTLNESAPPADASENPG